MADEFTHHILRMVVARICQPLGVHGMQNSVCDALVDILKNYLLTLGKTTAAYSCHANRTDPTLGDLQQAFNDLGVRLSDLSEFIREVESLSLVHQIPLYPVPRTSTHIHQPTTTTTTTTSETLTRQTRRGSLSSEDESDKEHIPPYLPPLPSKNEDKDEPMQEDGQDVSNEATETPEPIETVSGVPLTIDPLKGLPQLSRARGFSSDFSEDGDGGSRRNSICEWASIGTSSTPPESGNTKPDSGTKNEGGLIGNNTTLTPTAKQSVSEDVFVAPSTLTTRPKGGVLESIAGKKHSEPQTTDSKAQKSELGKISPLIDAKRVQPPPLRLMSPSTVEPPNPVFPVQQPPLSPLSRSPLPQLTGRPRMPVLSPLRAVPRPHPLSGTQVVSPSWKDVPPLRSPTELVQPVVPIEAHQVPTAALPTTTQGGSPAIPISAHPSIQAHTSPTKQTDSQAPVATATKHSPPPPVESSTKSEQSSTFKTQYKLPKSPKKVYLKDFHVVTERIQVRERRSSKSLSKSRSPTKSCSPTPITTSPTSSLPMATQQETEDVETKEEQDLSVSPSEDEASVTSEPSRHGSISPPRTAVDEGELVEEKQPPSGFDDAELSSPQGSPTKEESPAPVATVPEFDDTHNVSHLSDISSDEFEDVEEPLEAPKAVSDDHENVDASSHHQMEEDSELYGDVRDEPQKDKSAVNEEKMESPVTSPLTEPEQFQSPVPEPEISSSPIPGSDLPSSRLPDQPEIPSSPATESEQYPEDTIEASPPRSDIDDTASIEATKVLSERDEHSKSRSSSPSGASETEHRDKDEDGELVFEQNSNLETPFGSSEDQVMNIHEVVETIVEKDSVQLVQGSGDGVSDEVLEIFGQTISSDDSEDSGEGSVIGESVTGGGVECEDDMIETTSALPEPQVIVTTEQVKGRGRKVSRDELFGIKKDKKPPASKKKKPPPATTTSKQRTPSTLSLPVSIDRHLLSSLNRDLEQSSSSSKTSLLLTKAEMKAELSRIPGVPTLKVTSGPTKPVTLSPSHVASVLPSSAVAVVASTHLKEPQRESEDELSIHEENVQPLVISISRRLIRDSRFAITTPVEERGTKLPQATTAERVKMRLARFSSTLTTPPGPVGGALAVTTPTLNPRKRDISEIDIEDSAAKRQRIEEHQVYINPPHEQLSSSSSSSSSDEDDSGSDSLSCTPSPLPPPTPPTHHPSQAQSSSSDNEDDEPSTPASSGSSTLSGKGLKLTISKALLQQVRGGQPHTGSGKRGNTRGCPGRPAKQVKTSKKAPKKSSIPPPLPPPPPPAVATETKKGGRRKQAPRGSRGEGVDRGSKKSTISAGHGNTGLVIQSSKPIVLAPTSRSRTRAPPVTTATPTPSHAGSEYHCPECGLRDDGSPMIGCDGCDSWVHWTCAGVTREPPEDEKWYCSSCVTRRGGAKGGKKGRKKRK